MTLVTVVPACHSLAYPVPELVNSCRRATWTNHVALRHPCTIACLCNLMHSSTSLILHARHCYTNIISRINCSVNSSPISSSSKHQTEVFSSAQRLWLIGPVRAALEELRLKSRHLVPCWKPVISADCPLYSLNSKLFDEEEFNGEVQKVEAVTWDQLWRMQCGKQHGWERIEIRQSALKCLCDLERTRRR